MKITLDEFIAQWTAGMPKQNQLQFNIEEFVTQASRVSRLFFHRSFGYGGFYKSGKKWEARRSRWGKRFTHPVLFDSGKLRDNIDIDERKENSRPIFNQRGRTGFKNAKVWIYISTNEIYTPQKGKRGGKKRGSKLNYAAIHNTSQSTTPFTVNQYSSKKPVQRQFIGRSLLLDAEVAKLYPIIFKGFPHD